MVLKINTTENELVEKRWQEISGNIKKEYSRLLKDYRDPPVTVHFDYPRGTILKHVNLFSSDKMLVYAEVRKTDGKYLEYLFRFTGEYGELERRAVAGYPAVLPDFEDTEHYELIEVTWKDSFDYTNIKVTVYEKPGENCVLEVEGNFTDAELLRRVTEGTVAFENYWRLMTALNREGTHGRDLEI